VNPGPARTRFVLLTTILASSLAFIDGSVINVGLPAIGKDLGGDAAGLQWAINAYLLPLSALLLLGGAMGDRFGRRRMLLIGVGLFAAASAGCAAAPSLGWLFLARGLQGLGAALLLPASLAILGGDFEGAARDRAVGLWAAASSIFGAAGPVLGGWLIDTTGWRAIFLINPPLAAATVALALYSVRERQVEGERAPLDLIGGALATASLAGLTWGLTVASGPKGWSAGPAVAMAAGLVLAAGFIWQEKRMGERAMTPLSLFGSRSLVGLNLLTLLLYGALSGFMVLLPYRLIEVSHMPATAAGAALLPFPLVMTLASPAAGGLAGRIGARPLLIVGALIVAGGLALTVLIGGPDTYWTAVIPSVLVLALGMSCVAAPLTSAVLASVDSGHTGSASGLNSAVARTGGLIATALLGAVLAAHGQALAAEFRVAMLICALVAAVSSAIAALMVARAPRPA
jgi:EmrB/QacA subfamily drug resistance transporter